MNTSTAEKIARRPVVLFLILLALLTIAATWLALSYLCLARPYLLDPWSKQIREINL